MKKIMWLVALLVTVFTGAAFAEENTDADTSASAKEKKALGFELKMARILDQYQKNKVPTLKKNEVQAGLSVTYASSDDAPVGWRSSSRMLSMSTSLSYGIADGTEVSISVPFTTLSQRSNETLYSVGSVHHATGVGNPTVRFIKTLPTTDWSTAGIVSVTLPVGDKSISSNETHTSLGVNVSKIFRPAFLSGGVAWERDWKTARNGVSWNGGVGLFVNDTLTIGGDISGTININPPMGMPRDYTNAGVRVAYQKTPDFGVTVMATTGLTGAQQTSITVATNWKL